MTIRAVLTVGMGIALLASMGCQKAHPIGDDFFRALASQPTSRSQSIPTTKPVARAQSTAATLAKPTPPEPSSMAAASEAAAAVEPSFASTSPEASDDLPAPTPARDAAIQLAGKSESELRVLLGSPTEEEERSPGKRWRYRDGQCTLDVQLYPDVQTKQFGTLAYEVNSDDKTEKGRRLCLGRLQSRSEPRH